MVKMTFVPEGSDPIEIEASDDATLMLVAVRNAVDGIIGECGGCCSCGTCHVYVDEHWVEKCGRPSEHEVDILGFIENTRPNSRLACQIRMTDDLNGLVVGVPRI